MQLFEITLDDYNHGVFIFLHSGSNDCKRVCSETIEESKLFNCSDIHAWLTVKNLVLDVNAKNIFEVEVCVDFVKLNLAVSKKLDH